MLKYCAVLSLCAAIACSADFVTGQGARVVIGQATFTAQDDGNGGVYQALLGAAGGLAFANNTLFVTDSNRLGLTPLNNRVVIYQNVSGSFPGPTDPIAPFTGRCPLCGGKPAVVIGQPDFVTNTFGITQAGLRIPTAVATDGTHIAVADTASNRVLIWNSIPTVNGQPADVVVGQPDFTTVQAVVVNNKSLRAPQGVWFQNGKLYVADTLNNRVLIWNSIPKQNNAAADIVLGQADFNTVPQIDLTKASLNAQSNTMLDPVAVTSDGTRLFVTDLGHNRVLIWNSIPTQTQQPADVEIGQVDFQNAIANDTSHLCASNGTDSTGAATYPQRCAKTLSFPRFALSDGKRLFVADGGNDRVLVYNTIPTQSAPAADQILGEPDELTDLVTSNTDLFHPLLNQSAANVTPTPTALAWDGTNLYVTDPSNRRVLVFTPAAPLVPVNGVRNAASREIFALGAITIGGTIHADDQITVTINTRPYVYKVLKADTIGTILTALAGVVNAGNGDVDVLAVPEPILSAVKLQARKGGTDGNNIAISTTLSTNAMITATASGSTLAGGGEATVIAPGTIVSFFGTNLASTTVSADLSAAALPRELGGVQVYIDGIRAPVLMVSPTQVNAQVPFEVSDANSSSAYLRIQNADGSVTVTTAVGVPISQQNPGIFAATDGTEPRVAQAFHGSSYATGTILIDGSAVAGDVASIQIEDRTYSYTVQSDDTLASIRDALIVLINSNPQERVVASAAGAFTRIRLVAKVAGPEGDTITIGAVASNNTSVSVGPTNDHLCCANREGSPLTLANPAVGGETIVVYATGLGLVTPEEAKNAAVTGLKYSGPVLNDPNSFVSSLAGGSTANVISAGLAVGQVGVYKVVLELNSGLTYNPLGQLTISQDIYTSNIVTIPIGNSQGGGPTPQAVVAAQPAARPSQSPGNRSTQNERRSH